MFLKKEAVRASQVTLQYGVGAMIDFPSQTLMTSTQKNWIGCSDVNDNRLKKAIGINSLKKPNNNAVFVRFPEWYFCPKCHKFQPISNWIECLREQRINITSTVYQVGNPDTKVSDMKMIKNLFCPHCYNQYRTTIPLAPARFVTICENGHIDDFPWEMWTHQGEPCTSPQLELIQGNTSSEGLDGILVRCRNCGQQKSLSGIFNNGALENIGCYCTGRHPWKRNNNAERCDKLPHAVEKGSSSVYFPIIESSLSIPEINYDSMFYQSDYDDFLRNLNHDDSSWNTFIQIIQRNVNISDNCIKRIIKRKIDSENDEKLNTFSLHYRADEYDILANNVPKDCYEQNCDIEVEYFTQINIPFIKRISLVHKLREVQALIGFTRYKPYGVQYDEQTQEGMEGQNGEDLSKYVSVIAGEGNNKNCPAYETNGEGIFVEFNDNELRRWYENDRKNVDERIATLNKRYQNAFYKVNGCGDVKWKFVLLHTLSHLLIKELSFECGYSIASLKERLYCWDDVDGYSMSGFLIYTASGDSEGTLGGLVQQGIPNNFSRVFRKTLKKAESCSNDPICSLSTGQGIESLNLAACYSCTLIPETCCECRNVLLDRGLVVGTYDKENMGLYSGIIDNDEEWNRERNQGVVDNAQISMERPKISFDSCEALERYEDFSGWIYDNKGECDNLLVDTLSNKIAGNPQLYPSEFNCTDNETGTSCAAIWRNKHIALLLSENMEYYQNLIDDGWICICNKDNNIINLDKI